MKVALVHDHLTQQGGAEKVLWELQSIYPEAPMYTLICNPEVIPDFVSQKRIIPSFLQKFPYVFTKYRFLMPFMPCAVESFDFSGYDVVLSSASAFAKGVITKPETLHICYCHTPTRFLWSDTHQYLQELSAPWWMKKGLPFLLSSLRLWDSQAASRVDVFIANSKTVAARIWKYYGRKSEVIYPGVDVSFFSSSVQEQEGTYFLAGGRLVPYKRFDLIIQAFNQLQMPLKIFGKGPDEQRLKAMAHKHVEFVGEVSEEEKRSLYAGCKAFLHPQEEDFGITAIEAMACGRPVLAYKAGGATETIMDGKTGILFEKQHWLSLANEVIAFREKQFDSRVIVEHARQFDVSLFREKIKEMVLQKYAEKQATR